MHGGVAVETDQPKETPMDDRWADLDPETRTKIDGMSREAMELHLREEDPNSELRQGLAGEYFEERYKAASGGLTTDDFNRQMRLEAEEGELEEEDDGLYDEREPEDEPGTAHFEDEDEPVKD